MIKAGIACFFSLYTIRRRNLGAEALHDVHMEKASPCFSGNGGYYGAAVGNASIGRTNARDRCGRFSAGSGKKAEHRQFG
jgi:hypothetical protein